MARLSLEEMYDDRTLIKKIYDMISIVDSGTFNSLSSVQDGDDITVTFAMNDGTEKVFTFTANGIQNITSEQNGSVMTVNIRLTDGSTKTISWTITPGVTLDTEQTITAAKTLTALLTLTAGLSLTGTTTIDGDVQITNGHSLAVAGDIDAAADISGETLNILGQGEIAGMAIEPDTSGQTILSNEAGIRSASRVILTNIPTTTTGTIDTAAVNGARVQADLNAYPQMMRLSGNQTASGFKSGRFAMKETSVVIPQPATDGQYRLIYTIKDVATNTAVAGHIQVTSNLNYGFYGEFIALIGGSEVWGSITGISLGNYTGASIFFGYDGVDLDVWVMDQQYRPKMIRIDNVSNYGTLLQPTINFIGNVILADYTTYKTYTVTGSVTQ